MHLLTRLQELAKKQGLFLESLEFAEYLDTLPEFHSLRGEFQIPLVAGRPSIYMVGNSLGPQPKDAARMVQEELDVWGRDGHVGHFEHQHGRPWLTVDEACADLLLPIVGAVSGEVAAMASLTANLHFLMCSFYSPTPQRHKIIMESRAFPSDHLHGFDPRDSMILASPRQGEETLRMEDVLSLIKEHGDSVAVVFISGVQFLTGQLFDIPAIGAYAGFDLAHAVGNVPLHLHEWGVDFAAWCSYKYLNSGPGAIAGLFVHNKHDENDNLTILRGWWGHKVSTRFQMSNILLASLRIFSKTSLLEIRQRSSMLHVYLRYLLAPLASGAHPSIRLVTPSDLSACGAQLSVKILNGMPADEVAERCHSKGLMVDERKPDLIRMAPTGLYSTFSDVHAAATLFAEALKN
ncbi:Kynureninase [Paramicrosporidium saccamoebae]|uniref:Kynureninase n=1 Tax=Paramicrosporidium saccamoebae TaxID=1246581 RepID=A0A2H9TGR5_9FUNG|nr:Kynureninase [Paramicrosporidium saccamoebae]